MVGVVGSKVKLLSFFNATIKGIHHQVSILTVSIILLDLILDSLAELDMDEGV